jgi:hypothetical protein
MSEACLRTGRCERSSLPYGSTQGPFRGDTETQRQPHSVALAWTFQILFGFCQRPVFLQTSCRHHSGSCAIERMPSEAPELKLTTSLLDYDHDSSHSFKARTGISAAGRAIRTLKLDGKACSRGSHLST